MFSAFGNFPDIPEITISSPGETGWLLVGDTMVFAWFGNITDLLLKVYQM